MRRYSIAPALVLILALVTLPETQASSTDTPIEFSVAEETSAHEAPYPRLSFDAKTCKMKVDLKNPESKPMDASGEVGITLLPDNTLVGSMTSKFSFTGISAGDTASASISLQQACDLKRSKVLRLHARVSKFEINSVPAKAVTNFKLRARKSAPTPAPAAPTTSNNARSRIAQ